MKRPLFIILITAALCSCENTESTESIPLIRNSLFDSLEKGTAVFKIPDSLDVKLIVAAFFERNENAYSVIAYADSFKEEVYKITYLSNGTRRKEELKAEDFNSYKTLNNTTEYVVREKIVEAIHVDGNSSAVTQNYRVNLVKP